MDLSNTTNRATLKNYFRTNAIPSQGNFAALIDSLLNQADDGIAKPAGQPLSLQPDAADTAAKKVLNLYQSFADSVPAWTLGLKAPSAANTGLSIAAGNGSSKLFIDAASGNVGIGTIDPKNKLDIEGGAVIGSAYSGTSAAPNNGLLVQGKVGIGTPSPQAPLQVVGAGSRFGTSTDNYIEIGHGGSHSYVNGLGVGNLDLRTGGTTRMTVAAGGNVGIGTTSPAAKLDVDGNVLINSYDKGNESGIFFRKDYINSNKYNLSILTYDHGSSNSTSDGLSINAFDGISFSTGSNTRNERMRIDQAGKVGIGTTSPVCNLNIGANHTNVGNTTVASGAIINGKLNNSFTHDFSARDNADNGNTPIVVLASGIHSSNHLSLGIGGASWGHHTWIQGSYDRGSDDHGAKDLLLQPVGGKVCIGHTNSPSSSHKLHVDGSVNATSFSGQGSQLTHLNASEITSGTIDQARLPSTVVQYSNSGDLPMGGDLSINTDKKLSFSLKVRQMINLWGTGYGIGIQGYTQYFRTQKNFAWYKGGIHHDNELNDGGGTVQMVIKDGNVGIGTNSPEYPLHVNGSAQIDGSVNATSFSGQGSQLTHLNASEITSGTINQARLPSTVLQSGSDGNSGDLYMDGKLHISEATGTVHSANNGTLILDHENSGGASSIVFRSKKNRGSDYGYIQYQDDSSIDGTGERARLIIGTSNDASDDVILSPTGNVGIGTTSSPTQKLVVNGNAIIGEPDETLKVGNIGHSGWAGLAHTSRANISDYALMQNPSGNTVLNSKSDQPLSFRRGNRDKMVIDDIITIHQTAMAGTPNDYMKAQFVMSGGGQVTWGGSGGRLKWTKRFIAISMSCGNNCSTTGHINISQPTSAIPAANVYDGSSRSATEDGIELGGWEALYAVHSIGGTHSPVSFKIVSHKHDFSAPSNWLLVAVVNSDAENDSVRLGTGVIINKNAIYSNGSPIPRGVITMWSGAADNIPYGWALCDGNDSTPNLRGRFVLSQGANGHDVGETDGSETHTLTLAQIPSHRHGMTTRQDDYNVTGGSGPSFGKDNGDFTNHHYTSYAGEGHAHNNMPPFYVLAFIMKL